MRDVVGRVSVDRKNNTHTFNFLEERVQRCLKLDLQTPSRQHYSQFHQSYSRNAKPGIQRSRVFNRL